MRLSEKKNLLTQPIAWKALPFATPGRLEILHALVLAAFIGLAYYPSLGAPFVFDDFPNIIENQAVHPQNFTEIIRALDSPISSTRMVAMLSFAVNYWLDDLNVLGYHLFNIGLHLINCLLLYRIILIFPLASTSPPTGEPAWLDQVFRPPPQPADHAFRSTLAFWSAALWALNPVQTQAVTYIVQRMTGLATLFYLAAIYLFLCWRRKSLSAIPAGLLISACFLLGLASKEIVLTLPLALLLLDAIIGPPARDKGYRFVVIIGLLAAFIPGIIFLQQMPDWFATYPDRNFSPWERIMTQWRIVWHYLGLYLLPLPSRLHLAYDPLVSRSLLSPWTTLPGLIAMLGAWALAWRVRFYRPLLGFGILFFFLALAVESTFANLELAFIHRLYLPSAFLVPAGLSLLPPGSLRRSGVLLLLLLALWSFWTITRNDEWNRAERFWSVDLERGAAPARALNNQAAALTDSGHPGAAIKIFNQALVAAATDTDRKIVLYNLGTALFLENRLNEAMAVFKRLLADHGGFRHSYLFIGQILLRQGRDKELRQLINHLRTLDGHAFEAEILEANILTAEKKFPEAAAVLRQAIQKEPAGLLDRQLKLRLELARVFVLANDIQQAHQTYLEITGIFPQNYFAWTQLYHMLKAGGDHKGADVIRRFLKQRGVRLQLEPTPRSLIPADQPEKNN